MLHVVPGAHKGLHYVVSAFTGSFHVITLERVLQ